VSATIANRLLRVEKEAQEAIAHLDTKIQKGIMVQALINNEGIRKFIICKADHHEFINEESFERTRGLPIKKRVFKGFICDLNIIKPFQEIWFMISFFQNTGGLIF
jgi:hypothetical protein